MIVCISFSDPYQCDNDTLRTVFIPDYIVTGAEVLKSVGEAVTVNCAKDFQLFTKDVWDDNGMDNTLTLICKPDKKFDVPLASQLPQ